MINKNCSCVFICDNNSNDPDIHFPTIKPFLLITFFPLIVASKNRFSMITMSTIEAESAFAALQMQLAGSQQTHLQPCAGSRRANVQASPVQVSNRSSPVLGMTDLPGTTVKTT